MFLFVSDSSLRKCFFHYIIPYRRILYDGSDRRILCSSVISSSVSLSINIRSRVPVLLLVILNGASKSYTISRISLVVF